MIISLSYEEIVKTGRNTYECWDGLVAVKLSSEFGILLCKMQKISHNRLIQSIQNKLGLS